MGRHNTLTEAPVKPEDIEGTLASTATSIGKLRGALQVLPKVDDDGHSECPFARELYTEKERRQAEVQARLGALHESLWVVKAEIERCERNLGTVSTHGSQLNSDAARSHYTQAEGELAAQLERWRQVLDRIQEVIEDAEDALSEASAKPFPGGDAGFPVSPSVPPASAQPVPVMPGAPLPNAGQELEGIFAIDTQTRAGAKGRAACHLPSPKRDADDE